jgi:histidinol phosphatase-like PHP family hydrolase
MKRRSFIKTSAIAAGAITASPILGRVPDRNDYEFPLIDLHVHLTGAFTIEHVMSLARERNVQFGIVEHPASWAIKDNETLEKYINYLSQYPVYIGLQPIDLGWSKNFSPELLAKIDYILMDPQRVPMGNGEILKIWNFDTYIEDTEEFMKRYMDYSMQILENEPITIFGWPLFLPVCIARDYYSLWTEERMNMIIGAVKKRNIAIEINDMSHTPHEAFIKMARAEGLKFTFGSDSRNQNAGRLAYCKRIADKCGLTREDFYLPARVIPTGKSS